MFRSELIFQFLFCLSQTAKQQYTLIYTPTYGLVSLLQIISKDSVLQMPHLMPHFTIHILLT